MARPTRPDPDGQTGPAVSCGPEVPFGRAGASLCACDPLGTGDPRRTSGADGRPDGYDLADGPGLGEVPGAGHGHGAGHAHGHLGARYGGRIAATSALTLGLVVVEVWVGVLSGSMAVLSDAGHLGADVLSLGVSALATRLARRPDHTGRRSYGSYRAEIFAALLSVLIMIVVSGTVVTEAGQRLAHGGSVVVWPMVAVGLAAVLVNGIAALLLREGAEASLTVRGAYLEVLGDAVGGLGVVLAAGLVALTGWTAWDRVAALGVGAFLGVRAFLLGRQVYAVLAQHVPAGVDPIAVAADLEALDGVQEVHHLHLWTLTSGMHDATAHLVTVEGADPHAVLDRARDLLRVRHGLVHATVQVEPPGHLGCAETDW